MIGFKRLTEVCQGLFGLTISQGAISNALARIGEAIAAPAERIAAEVRASEVIASDETSARVKGKTCGSGRSAARQPSTSSSPRPAASACQRRFSPARSRRCGCRTGCPRS
jgi:hypothetical protein